MDEIRARFWDAFRAHGFEGAQASQEGFGHLLITREFADGSRAKDIQVHFAPQVIAAMERRDETASAAILEGACTAISMALLEDQFCSQGRATDYIHVKITPDVLPI